MADPLSTALKQGGKTKRQGHRTLLLAGAGVVLLVVYLVKRQSASTAAVTAASNPSALPAAGSSSTPSTFADNGSQAASLGDAVTNSLSGLQTSIDAQTNAFNGLTGQLSAPAQPASVPVPAPATPAGLIDPSAFASLASSLMALSPGSYGGAGPTMGSTPANTPAGQVGQPAAPRASSVATAQPGVRQNTQVGNPRAGQTYTVQAAPGGTYHVYAGGKKIFVKAK